MNAAEYTDVESDLLDGCDAFAVRLMHGRRLRRHDDDRCSRRACAFTVSTRKCVRTERKQRKSSVGENKRTTRKIYDLLIP
jgi:hypothetical protein